MKLNFTLPLVVSALALSACSQSTDYNFDRSAELAREEAAANAAPGAVFNPPSELPFPNSVAFLGTQDGTLNIPLSEGVAADDYGDPIVALNTLDGFSTTQPLTTSFGNALDPASVVLGETVRIFEVTTGQAGLVTGVVGELVAGQVLATVVGGTTLAIVPLSPLKESTDYMVLATNGLKGLDGQPSGPSSAFRLVSGTIPLEGERLGPLEPLRIATNSMLDVAAGQSVERSNVVQIWSTKTQSITPVMNAIKSASQSGGAITVAPTGKNTNDVSEALPGIADIYIGTLDVPYYLTPPANANDPAGVSSFWRAQGGEFLTRSNAVPVATSVQTIPVLMSLPNANSGRTAPATGWPVAIFVHGVGQDRTNMIAMADRMAGAGFAVIAIDQVMHGITDLSPENPYAEIAAANTPFPNDRERTFDIDVVNNETGALGKDDKADASGTHFYSPGRLLTTRDNLRQSAADLLVLSASLGNIPGVLLDTSRKVVIGHSLGGTTATTFAAFDDSLSAVSLGMPAAGLVQTTITSLSFGPRIKAGLAEAGIEENTPEFAQFLVAAQTVVDSGDPISFGAQAASMHPIHMIEVVGDGTEASPADTVVFNNIPGAPLAGTEALARVMGLGTVTGDFNGSGLVKFIGGNHSSLLLPGERPDVLTEMQTQVATFAATAVTTGALIKVTNPSLIVTSE